MQKKDIKAVLFDLDGVLVDSLDAWFYVFNDSLGSFGFGKLSKKEFTRDFGAPIEKDVKKHFRGKTVKEVESAYNACFNKRAKYVKLSAQAKNVLQKLKNKNIKIGLVTNSTSLITLAILRHFKLTGYFDVILTMNDVRRGKPHPDMALKACKMLKVSPKCALLVGDTQNDMLAGKRAGCFTIGYKTKGDLEIKKLNEIFFLLQ